MQQRSHELVPAAPMAMSATDIRSAMLDTPDLISSSPKLSANVSMDASLPALAAPLTTATVHSEALAVPARASRTSSALLSGSKPPIDTRT